MTVLAVLEIMTTTILVNVLKEYESLINDCASGFGNYDHYDTSKRVKRILKLDK